MTLGFSTFVGVALGFLAVASATVAQEGKVKEAFSTWTVLTILGQRPDVATELLVQNGASVPIQLSNCEASYAVPARANTTMTLDKLDAFWVVPDGVAWDCSVGPFDLFYIDANLTSANIVASVGYGFFDKEPVSARVSEQSGTAEELTKAGSHGILSIVLVAGDGGAGSDGTAVGCGVGACGENQEITAPAKYSLTLSVVGSQPTMLSNWGYGHGHGHGGHGHWGHHYGHGHGHWGHHYGHGHWGYGHRGWRRGAWGLR